MVRGEARRFTAAEHEQLWLRWKRGESASEIGRGLSRAVQSVMSVLRRHGGIAPPVRSRAERALSWVEREEISRGLAAGHSYRHIGARLGRSASTICREVSRNGGRVQYRAVDAEQRAERMARRPKRCKLAEHSLLRRVVEAKLKQNWSPQQVSGWLRQHYPGEASLQVSHESIYRTLFVQSRGL